MKQIDVLSLSDQLEELLQNKPSAEHLDEIDGFYNQLELIHMKLTQAEAYYNTQLAKALSKFEAEQPARWKQIKNSSTLSLEVIGGQQPEIFYNFKAAVSLRTTIEKVFANTNTIISAMKVEIDQGLRRPDNNSKQNNYKVKQRMEQEEMLILKTNFDNEKAY